MVGLWATAYFDPSSVTKREKKEFYNIAIREEQIIQKEQILAELQRVEKELQEKAQTQIMLSAATSTMMQRQQDHQQQQEPQLSNEVLQNNNSVSFGTFKLRM